MRMFNLEGNVVAVACDRWKCDVCRSVLSRRWGTRVRYGLALWGSPAYHWTLTLPGKVKSARYAFILLPSIWDNFRKSLQRELGQWDYAAFVELHPKRHGIAHFHIISLAKSPGRLKDRATHAGFGYMATEDLVEGWRAAYYVSKYTSKQGAQMPKGFRRVRLSHRWPDLPDAAYEIPLYPLQKRETLSVYLHRMSLVSGLPEIDLQARWEHKELDL